MEKPSQTNSTAIDEPTNKCKFLWDSSIRNIIFFIKPFVMWRQSA